MISVKFVIAWLSFILVSIIEVWLVTKVMEDSKYWLLTALMLPLVVVMTIAVTLGNGNNYRWLASANLFILTSNIPTIWILQLYLQENTARYPQCMRSVNSSVDEDMINDSDILTIKDALMSICPNVWISYFYLLLLIFVTPGRQFFPQMKRPTPDERSRFLVIFFYTAADIVHFTTATLSDVNDDRPWLVYVILAVWTWCMLQFPLRMADGTSQLENSDEPVGGDGNSFLLRHSVDMKSLFFQDGPFLGVRLAVFVYYGMGHQMLFFFILKNALVVLHNLLRLIVIFRDFYLNPYPDPPLIKVNV